jgi:outer membrane protein OmpA-like peptidoglycan-associated protein
MGDAYQHRWAPDQFLLADLRGRGWFDNLGCRDAHDAQARWAHEWQGLSILRDGRGRRRGSWGAQQTVSARVYFTAHSFTLSAGQKSQLRKLVASLPKGCLVVKVTVTGYVQRTAATHNDAALSHGRALAAAQYLRSLGVTAPIALSGKGAETGGTQSRAADVTVYFRQ